MLKIEAIGKVYYTCTLTDDEEQKILEYIKSNEDDFEFMSEKEKIIKAVDELYSESEINLYDNAVESDFETQEIKWSQFEERNAKDILKDI